MKEDIDFFIMAMYDKLIKETNEFPSVHCGLITLTEKMGELAQAISHFYLEHEGSSVQIARKALPVAVTALRLTLSDDLTARRKIKR